MIEDALAGRIDLIITKSVSRFARNTVDSLSTITKRQAQRQMMENFIKVLRSLPEQVDYFDESTWYAMCNFITVYGKNDIRVTFHNGMEIRV